MSNEYRDALQRLFDSDFTCLKDHACHKCTDRPLQWPSIPKGWLCAYHNAEEVLSRPEAAQVRTIDVVMSPRIFIFRRIRDAETGKQLDLGEHRFGEEEFVIRIPLSPVTLKDET